MACNGCGALHSMTAVCALGDAARARSCAHPAAQLPQENDVGLIE